MSLKLSLYVNLTAFRTPRIVEAVERTFADGLAAGDVHLEVIDVLTNPRRLEAANIVVTPTLVRESPTPEKRVVGDLSRPGKLAGIVEKSW
ncbi:MAG: circadian clock KaiB family protein [Sandaracinaceae bacterium]